MGGASGRSRSACERSVSESGDPQDESHHLSGACALQCSTAVPLEIQGTGCAKGQLRAGLMMPPYESPIAQNFLICPTISSPSLSHDICSDDRSQSFALFAPSILRDRVLPTHVRLTQGCTTYLNLEVPSAAEYIILFSCRRYTINRIVSQCAKSRLRQVSVKRMARSGSSCVSHSV